MRVGRERLKKILAIIGEMYPEARGELEWETPFQLLIAVILSAQTTDKAVNKITPNLWKKYPEIADLANANLEDVEDCLRTIGLYKNKAKNIVKTARAILRDLMAKFQRLIRSLKVCLELDVRRLMLFWQKCMVSRPSLWILMCRVSLNVSISQHQMLMLPKLSKT